MIFYQPIKSFKALSFISIIFLFLALNVSSQQSLQVITERFGKVKKYEIFPKELLHYKLKGQLFYKTNTIVNLRDSFIVFSNDSVIRLNRIKAIRLDSKNHLAQTFRSIFIVGGIGFIALNTTNNAINDVSPLIDKRAVYVSGALIGTGILMKFLTTKYIRINKRKVVKISEINYSDLNKKQP